MYRSAGILVIVLLAVSLPSEAKGVEKYEDKDGSHSIVMGNRKMVLNKPADIHIYHESLKTDGRMGRVNEDDICYPYKNSKQAKFTITSISISDPNNKALVYVKKDGGGVGKHKVCFHVKGQRGKGYTLDIDVFGTFK